MFSGTACDQKPVWVCGRGYIAPQASALGRACSGNAGVGLSKSLALGWRGPGYGSPLLCFPARGLGTRRLGSQRRRPWLERE